MSRIKPRMKRVVSRNVVSVTNAIANLDRYLIIDFTYIDNDSNYEEKNVKVNVFKNNEYEVVFYNADTRSYETLTGMVVDFAGSSTTPAIVLKYLEKSEKDDNKCCPDHEHFNCGCILTDKPNLESKYASPKFISIPTFNINSITYKGLTSCVTFKEHEKLEPTPIKKEGVKYLLLGINAEILKLMRVNLKFIDDKFEDAFKTINLKIGAKYNIVYTDNDCDNHCEESIYEIEGTLVGIEEVYNENNNSSCIVRMNNCEHPEEIVGVHNSIYCGCDVSSDKDKFSTGHSCDMDIMLTFDTMSTPVSGSLDIVYLSQIRDVNVIDDNSTSNESCFDDTTTDRCCDCCLNGKTEHVVDGVTYIYEDGFISRKAEDCCPCDNQEYSLEELIQYFFGGEC